MGKFLGTYMQTCIIKILGNNFQQQWQHPITKKADAEPKKSRSNKKSRCRNSLLKNGPTKLPCLLIILASWVDFFDIGLLLYPLPHHTLQCCTRKSFWVTRTGESKLFCIGFSLFWSRCRKWSTYFLKYSKISLLSSNVGMGLTIGYWCYELTFWTPWFRRWGLVEPLSLSTNIPAFNSNTVFSSSIFDIAQLVGSNGFPQ